MWIVGERFAINESVPPIAGGMADVYKAIDTQRDGQLAAIKLFRDGLIDGRLTLEVFSRETGSLSELSHRNIAKLLDCGNNKDSERK